MLGDHRDAVALAPDLQLLRRCGAEGVTGGKHDLLAVELQFLGQLADGGGLADAVHADHQDHVGTLAGIDRQRLLDRRAGRRAPPAARYRERAAVNQLLARDAPGEFCMIAVVASTPTSAVSRRVSSSSSRSSSMAFLPRNRLAIPSPMLALVFDSPGAGERRSRAWLGPPARSLRPGQVPAQAQAQPRVRGAAAPALCPQPVAYRPRPRAPVALPEVSRQAIRQAPGLFDRFAVRLFSGGLLCRRGLRLLAQPAEQAFLSPGSAGVFLSSLEPNMEKVFSGCETPAAWLPA